MDFEDAAVRLARDQSKMKNRTTASKGLGEKAKRQAVYQKRQQEKLRLEREEKKRIEQYQKEYMRSGARALHEMMLGPMMVNNESGTNKNKPTTGRQPLILQPTSVWGDGDKIALPPSVLETLTVTTLNNNSDNYNIDNSSNDGPWTFRIGIPNPEYKFPMSSRVKELRPSQIGNLEDGDDVAMGDGSDDDDDADDNTTNTWEAYLDELDYKYLAYTHCSVVEFTQEDGYVGIPQPIASALLDPANNHHRTKQDGEENELITSIKATRTVDPASLASVTIDDNNDGNDADQANAMDTASTSGDDKTPGHIAWGAFDIPDVPGLEITLVKLPKGTGATLTPTPEAVRRNFYGLKDVKLVLEQSLIRTRATLSQGDVVSTWHRGVRFDLKVTKLLPSAFHAVLCINTDIEVDIGEVGIDDDTKDLASPSFESSATKNPSDERKGFRLGSTGSERQTVASSAAAVATAETQAFSKDIKLPPEPPADQKEWVCTVQIRHSVGQGIRRFDIKTARIKDLFAFASSLMHRDETTFRLVTRFPRREWSLKDGGMTFADAGIQQGQEMFLCENL